ncbi:kelch repeat-containing protein [Chryseolinea sp. T2]|uniref:kelch repeat-containing protein n=1 Tax=Chryseolinea sp. T2 TaxID=3129255 RepID=UPI0030777D9C
MKRLFTVTFLLTICSLAYSQTGGSWVKKADVGTSNRESAVGFSVNSKGYIGLGIVGGSPNGAMWEFDPTTNVWTQKANMTGGGRVNPVAFVVSNRVFVGTGEDITFTRDRKIYEFNPLANNWTAKADFGGTARTEAVAFAIGTKGYIGTGYDGTRRKDFWEYDPTTNAWTQKADFAGTARQRAVGFSIGTKGYIGTGNDGSLKKDFWEYDQATNTWTQKADMAGGTRESAVGFSMLSKGYIATGDGGTGKNDIWEYNPAQDEWVQRTPLIGDRRYVAAGFATSSKAYIGTGFTDAPAIGVSTKDFYEFSAPQPPQPPTNAMVTSYSENSIRLHWLDNAYDETGFIVERSTNGTTFTTITTLPANSLTYTDNGLSNGQTYYYRVRAAKSTDGPSAASNVASQITGSNNNGVWNTISENSNSGNPYLLDAPTFSINDIVYVTGSQDASNVLSNAAKQLWSFDPATGTYTQKAEFPGDARLYGIGFALNGKGYFGAGTKGSGTANILKDFWAYDPSTNTWAQKADIGTVGRSYGFSFTTGGKGYVGGGYLSTTGTAGKDFYEYDPSSDVWTQKADYPNVSSTSEGVGYNNKGYVLESGSPATVYEYDPSGNTWTAVVKFPVPSFRFNTFVAMGNRLFAHIFTNNSPDKSMLWEFEVANKRWIERALHYDGSQYWSCITSATSNAIYLFNGTSSYSWSSDFGVKTPVSLAAEVFDPMKIKLTWQAYSDAATIQIYRAESEAGPYTLVAQVAGNQKTFVDEFNSSNKTVYYKVKAVNGSLESSYSKVAMASNRGGWKKISTIANATTELFGDAAASTSTRAYLGINLWTQKWWEYNPESDAWTQKADFPGEPRSYPITFSIANKIYVGMGSKYDYTNQKTIYYKDFYEYDPATNSWTKKGDFPGVARSNQSIVSTESKGYLIGGDDGSTSAEFLKDAWQYDPSTDTWAGMIDAPVGFSTAAAFAKDNKVYLMNGWRKSSGGGWSSVLQAYSMDLTTGAWTKNPNPPGLDATGTVHQINNIAYFSERGMGSYNFVSKQWALKPALPASGYYSSRSFLISKKIYVITSNYEMWVYSPEALVAPPENLDSKFLGDRVLLTWNQTSSLTVKTKIQYQTGSGYYRDVTTVAAGITQFAVTDLTANTNYKFQVIAVNENGDESIPSNNTFENSGPAWTELGEIPAIQRENSISFFADGKLYYGTGKKDGNYLKDIWEYNTATGVWSQKADFPGEERAEATTFTLGTDSYVGFGTGKSGSLKDLYKYSATTNTWTASVNYPNGNSIVGPGVFNNGAYVYLIGGVRNSTASINELWRFDGTTWTQLTSLPGETRKDPFTFTINGKAYVAGGSKYNSGSTTSGGRDFWSYDFANDSWTQLTDIPNDGTTGARSYSITGANKALVFFVPNWAYGNEGIGIRIYGYTPATDKWAFVDKPLYTDWLSNVFTVTQDPVSGFGYVMVSTGTWGHKVWRYNTLLDGPNLVEVKVSSPGQARLKWRRITPQPDSVVIFRSQIPNVAGTRQGVVITSDTTAVNNIGSGTTYYYKIRAYSNNGQFKTSSEQSLTVDAVPAAPVQLTGDVIGDNVVLNWSPGIGSTPTSYVVERALGNSSNFQEIGRTTSTTLTSSEIVAATMSYRVKAINSGGESTYSNIVEVMVTGVEEESKIGVYPNPTTDFITVEVAPQDGIVNMQLLDYNGRKVFAQPLNSTTRIDMSSYPAGIYFVNLVSTKRASNKYIKIIKK